VSGLIVSLIVLGLSGPLLWLLRPHRSHLFAWLAATPPALVCIWLIASLPAVSAGAVLAVDYPWIPDLGLNLTLRIDGLGLLFGVIIAGIGAAIAFYANYYFEGDERQGFFYLLFFAFMVSMLGVVWADNLFLLFVFWEGTSVTSYLLIAFKTSYKGAVDGARRALIVTTAGGLAMLAGMVLLGQAVGDFTISKIVATPGLTELAIYPAALVLLLLGAFTKSAQFPFQFWLPGAMAAPTPASAYLHSATMVKAGVYLLARLHPGMADSSLWFWSLLVVGGITMVLGAVSALRYTDMKALLAYATVSQLGVFVFLLAFDSPAALLAAMVAILAHSLYKAPLFLMAGIVDHATGTRDLRQLAGLARGLPLVAAVAVIAGLSMAGIPPTLGFLAKELLLEEIVHLYEHGEQLLGGAAYLAAMVMAIFTVAAILTLLWEAFFRRRADEAEPAHVHHAPSFWFVLMPLLLALVGLLLPLVGLGWVGQLTTAAAATADPAANTLYLALWHGWTIAFYSSLAALGLGLLVFMLRRGVRGFFARMPERMTSLYVYDAFVDVIYRFARSLTRLVQGGPMAPQISVTLLAGVLAMVYALFHAPIFRPVLLEFPEMPSLTEILIYIVAMLAAIITVQAKSRLSAIISLGVVGVAVTVFFIIYSAPDLAITQLLIEVLTVVLLVLVFFRVKPDAPIQDSLRRRVLRLLIALSVGAFGFGIVLINHLVQVGPSISPYFLENALPIGQGGNVVNVILVDIRGYDTLGEITVLGLAALGGYAVLRSPQLHALRRKIAAQRQEDKRLAAGGGDD